MGATGDSPGRQFVAAWQAVTAVAAEWAERTAAVTAEAFRKLTSDPAFQAVGGVWRDLAGWPQRDCRCSCADSHPEDIGVCDERAVISRRLPAGQDDAVDVPMCAPCAVAQGVAELPR